MVVTPEYLRQYSMSGDPANAASYQIGVLREDQGRGGSIMLQRIFTEGRRVFISKPINHFELDETASRTFLMGGGIGITPMIGFAHRLHALGAAFELHYSAHRRADAGYRADLETVPWADRVRFHFSDQGTRADLDAILVGYRPGWHVYICGPDRYMTGVIAAAERQGFPEEARHLAYFSLPEEPDYANHAVRVRLARSGRVLELPEDRSISDVPTAAGVALDVRCSDGRCGVCRCGRVAGAVAHRDFVLSAAQKDRELVTCRSRAAPGCAEITLDL